MSDYRDPSYKEFYKQFGFIVLLTAIFMLAFKAMNWVLWAQQFINASL